MDADPRLIATNGRVGHFNGSGVIRPSELPSHFQQLVVAQSGDAYNVGVQGEVSQR
jgi:hypothetical protein